MDYHEASCADEGRYGHPNVYIAHEIHLRNRPNCTTLNRESQGIEVEISGKKKRRGEERSYGRSVPANTCQARSDFATKLKII